MTKEEREVARDLFSKCYSCGESVQATPTEDLAEVAGRSNRLVHLDCLAGIPVSSAPIVAPYPPQRGS